MQLASTLYIKCQYDRTECEWSCNKKICRLAWERRKFRRIAHLSKDQLNRMSSVRAHLLVMYTGGYGLSIHVCTGGYGLRVSRLWAIECLYTIQSPSMYAGELISTLKPYVRRGFSLIWTWHSPASGIWLSMSKHHLRSCAKFKLGLCQKKTRKQIS